MPTPGLDPAQLRSLFRQALDLDPGARARFLHDLPPAVAEELALLLEADHGAETFIRETVASEQPPDSGAGQRFGSFETVELIGRGGMGAVFKARRADGELAQTVAIKVVDRGWLDRRALDRFLQERQILAGLDHPNIARLIDGGTRSDGVAYLVMEYVDGLRLDEYCEKQHLPIAARLRLFLPLCDAVEYAHQKLIIHRDLKPSNVLVTAQGQPKLLDFGIAKALDSTAGGRTQTLLLTPDFASPEQARGEEITTATDVYGLGAVLYFLLTGRAPHASAGLSAAELQRAICDTAPERPGALRPELKGDLENILLQALHADPRRRYRSVREFADEIERYLSRRPVRATPDSLWYRLRRLVERHALASAAVTLAVVAVLGGTAVSLYEAHRARQRFAQVRELANRFVFDFEAAIRDTPGTLAARRMVASTARQYLASLAGDAGRDPALRRELAESYYRLAKVERGAGESTPAIEHLQKSIDILRALKDDCCGPPPQRELYINAMDDLVLYQKDARGSRESLASSDMVLAAARAWYTESARDPVAARALLNTLSIRGSLLPDLGRLRDARRILEEAVKLSDELGARDPKDEEIRYLRVIARYRLALALGNLGEPASALDTQRQAQSIVEPFLQEHPKNTRWRVLQISVVTSISAMLRKLAGDDPSLAAEALAVEKSAYTLARANARENPDNKRMLDDAAVQTEKFGNRLREGGKAAEALPLLREALAGWDEIVKGDPSDHRRRRNQCNSRQDLGYCLMDLKRWDEARSVLQQGAQLSQAVMAKWPDDLLAANTRIGILAGWAEAERNLGRLDAARGLCRQAFQIARDLAARNPEAKTPVENMEMLRQEGRQLGVN